MIAIKADLPMSVKEYLNSLHKEERGDQIDTIVETFLMHLVDGMFLNHDEVKEHVLQMIASEFKNGPYSKSHVKKDACAAGWKSDS